MPSVISYTICVVRRLSATYTSTEYQRSATYGISSCVNSDIRSTKSSKEVNSNISYMRTEYFLAAMEKQRDEGEGRILLGDNTGGAAVQLRQVRFRLVGTSLSTEHTCTYIYIHKQLTIRRYIQFWIVRDLPERNNGLSRGTYRWASTDSMCLRTRAEENV